MIKLIKKVKSWSKPDLPNLIGRKKVDWTIFESGTHIPFDFHGDFAEANGYENINMGDKKQITLIIDGESYQAQLIKDSKKGYLELRYNDKKLKDLIKTTFKTSYQYFIDNREKKSKKQLYTPEDKEEFIDFFQTDKPYVYEVKLISKTNKNSQKTFWWVNQGKTHKQEKEGEFLWAPKTNKSGNPVPHHISLLKANIGDIVLCYSASGIKSIGIVKEKAVESDKPIEITSSEWQQEGYLLKLNYFNLEPEIRKDEIPEKWRLEENGSFDRNGNVKQGYFFEVSEKFIKKLYNKFYERFPIEIRNVLGDYEQPKKHENGEESNEENGEYLTNMNLIEHIYNFIQGKGFYYTKEEITNLFLSLKTKPFVILSGISGTGKTKMVQWFAESLGATEENGRSKLIPIRPDWNDGSELLGYKDIKEEFIEGPLTEIIIRATNSPEYPFFVLLDEMNLARVEYYFSDILSIMESRKWHDNQILTSVLLSKEITKYEKDLRIPSNLYFIGTVNMDETTFPFSKKVLDRANTIEFNRVELSNLSFLETQEEVSPENIQNNRLAPKYLHLKDVYQVYPALVKNITIELEKINKSLQKINAHIGYRVRDEICFYMAYNEEEQLMTYQKAFDHCILQKVLPRITGSDHRVELLLKELYQIFSNQEYVDGIEFEEIDSKLAKYPKSAGKVVEMLRRFNADGFTSFWIS